MFGEACECYVDEGAVYEAFLLQQLQEGSLTYKEDTTALVQGSSAWFKARKSRLTGSNIAAAVGLSPYATPHSLWEKLTGKLPQQDLFTSSSATRHGNHYEDFVVKLYTDITKRVVVETGFWLHPEHQKWLGASPDGLIGKNGVLEIKCPIHHVHETVPRYYMPQLQAEMACTSRSYVDYCSWHYRPEKVGGTCSSSRGSSTSTGGKVSSKGRLRIMRVLKSDEYWSWLLIKMKLFWNCVENDKSPRGVVGLEVPSMEPPAVIVTLLMDVDTAIPDK